MFTRVSRLPGLIIIVGPVAAVNRAYLNCGNRRGEVRRHTARVTIQSRHASEDSCRIAHVFFDAVLVSC